MTREDIVRMADASGLSLYGMGKDREQFIDYLECFADLVAQAESEACAKLCEEAPEPDGADLAERIRARQ
jgi:hypothetical protein